MRFPIPLLPKREAFLYLAAQRKSEQFWDNFLRDLRATGSIYGTAIDGMIARGGIVTVDAFSVISGAPHLPQKGQVAASLVAKRLVSAGVLKSDNDKNGAPCFVLMKEFDAPGPLPYQANDAADSVLLDGVREWARKLGLASYNSIAIRGEPKLRPIGPFLFDLAGPSYLLPLQGGSTNPGFLVADVFSEGVLTTDQVQFFIRKARMLKAGLKGVGVLSILVAEGFTGPALTAGHAAGVVLTTPKDLFGTRVGMAMKSLVETLKDAARYASSSPERLVSLIDNLADIEGRAGNLRGILFELIAGYLARRDAVSIDMGVKAKDPESGKIADIDVEKITSHTSSVTAIECKGKAPGGVVDVGAIEEWLEKISIIRAHYKAQPRFREAIVRFEFWTSGTFHPDALALLESEKRKRTKAPIDWKDGASILSLAATGREKAIADALYQHFLKHPLAEVVMQRTPNGEDSALKRTGLSSELAPYVSYAIYPDGQEALSTEK